MQAYTTFYTLRLTDEQEALWAEFRSLSEREGIPMRTVLLKLIALYTSGEVQIVASKNGENHG